MVKVLRACVIGEADKMLAPWVGLHLKRTPKDAEATHATHTSTLGNQESVLAGGDPNHFGAPPASFC
jgi:hypothetical protein